MASTAPCLLLFARAPESLRVKTRLEPALGTAGAAALYRAFLEDAARRYAPRSRWSGVVCADPDASSPLLRSFFRPPWRIEAQASGNLGARLESAFRGAFGRGTPAAVALGSDHPALSRERLSQVFERLAAGEPAAVIPAADGGYCAIGLRRGSRLGEIFGDIPWSSDSVLDATLDRLAAAGIRATVLEPSYDVDRPEDLERLAAELAGRDPADADYPRATAEALAALPRAGKA